MNFSSVAIEQRQKEAKVLKSFLAFSLIGSLALHVAVLTFGIGTLSNEAPKIEEEPVEVIVVDPPPTPKVEKPPEKTQPQQEGGSAASGSSSSSASRGASSVEKTQVPRNSSRVRQSPIRATPRATARAVPKPKLRVAPSAPPTPVAKQPSPKITNSQRELVEELKRAPIQQPKITPENLNREPTQQPKTTPEVTNSTKPVTPPSPQLSAIPNPTTSAQTPAQDIARERSAANSTASSENPSGEGDRSGSVATGSGNGTTDSTDSRGGSTSGQGSGSQVAVGTGSNRQGTPGGQGSGSGSGEGDSEGSGTGVACRRNCKPKYPERARRQGQEGRVVVRVVADANGNVTSAQVARSSGNSALDEAALKQARRAKIKAQPGKPVTMNFNFSLKD